ncbi:MAG: hypothetical protein QOG64_383 [Acidimicrobiaceae bacterium]|jgi:hypothetical protein|nr:hypothetical protein [Acidimicrobiaceae bacterium]
MSDVLTAQVRAILQAWAPFGTPRSVVATIRGEKSLVLIGHGRPN